ncbi:MAG: YfcE family phosphodiesterase [Phycisphaerales bacterium]|nr:MAG: YfcE family phosphodiesterase [Phycisphaerales bacterium]
MLIGILSDSHGRCKAVRRAVALFDRLGAGMIIHCGDVGDLGVLDEMAGRNCRFVWGNMDEPSSAVDAHLETLGIPPPDHQGLSIDVDGKHILVFHGHEPTFRRAIHEQAADYVLHGHTHQPCNRRVGAVRVVNPGALHRAKPRTVATLDTATDDVTFYDIDSP